MNTSRILFAEDIETRTEQLNNAIASLQAIDPKKLKGVVIGILTQSDPAETTQDLEEGVPVDFQAFLMGVPEGIKFVFGKLWENTVSALQDAATGHESSDKLN